MKRKEIMELLEQLDTVSIDRFFEMAEVQSGGDKKRVVRILEDFVKEDFVTVNWDEGKIYRNAMRDREKEEKRLKRFIKKQIRRTVERKPKPAGSPQTDFDRIVDKHEIKREFPVPALKEAEIIPIEIGPEEIARRLDLRKKLIVTIDGVDAKDLDDAVSLAKTADGWELGVHIADVSHYVTAKTRLDKEALHRGNSFYFVNKVVPMFPEKISNGICSLNPREDKLTVSVIMKLDKKGNVVSSEIKNTVICTSYRLNYGDVQKTLDGELAVEDEALKRMLIEARELFQMLYENRMKIGGIDFDFKEQKMELDENDLPAKIWLKPRLDSERIIEEFMLIANKTAAHYLAQRGVSLFRIHEVPATEKISEFVRILLRFGHKTYGVPVPEPQEIQKLLLEIKDKPYKEFISQLLLRSMQQARYDTENLGHYGLGFEFYTHFTSPIRRYADLVVHRLLKNTIDAQNKTDYNEEELNQIAEHISKTERVAMDAERDFFKIKAIRFMEDKIGRLYEGLITGITGFGIFVQIPDYGVEGLVRYFDMDDDFYVYSEKDYSAIGQKKKRRYTMGDRLKVIVKRADAAKGFLDLKVHSGNKPFQSEKEPNQTENE